METQNVILLSFAAVLFLLMIKTGADIWEMRRKPRNPPEDDPHVFEYDDESNPNR